MGSFTHPPFDCGWVSIDSPLGQPPLSSRAVAWARAGDPELARALF